MAIELDVMAAVLYLARHDPHWQPRPYWMLRRCVVPYVQARQFVLLGSDGEPGAFAAWAKARADGSQPWREQRYLPSAMEIAGEGEACVTEIIAPPAQRSRVLEEVARHLGLPRAPAWIERDAERRVLAVHE
ncbi:MAG TPA: toxin-activating lysine-acyltransferase [Burkholderiales bacterium]